MVERISFVAGFYDAGKAMHCQIHQTKLGIILHLFLAEKGHGVIGAHSRVFDEISGLYKHTATAAGGIEQCSLRRLQYIDYHLHQGLRRKEHTIVLRHILGKFI